MRVQHRNTQELQHLQHVIVQRKFSLDSLEYGDPFKQPNQLKKPHETKHAHQLERLGLRGRRHVVAALGYAEDDVIGYGGRQVQRQPRGDVFASDLVGGVNQHLVLVAERCEEVDDDVEREHHLQQAIEPEPHSVHLVYEALLGGDERHLERSHDGHVHHGHGHERLPNADELAIHAQHIPRPDALVCGPRGFSCAVLDERGDVLLLVLGGVVDGELARQRRQHARGRALDPRRRRSPRPPRRPRRLRRRH
mmetsp:Transcript_24231/g.59503  ORF Transcript_24231/g.59503 Transcript_24231/m.59503 type:complete len:251 (+) Transcript_24231:1614-2366(+)